MKNHSLKAEIFIFSSIILLFILPPFFTPFINTNYALFSNWSFPFSQIIYGLIAGFIFFYLKDEKNKALFLRFPVILTVGLLFCSSLVMKFIAELLKTENTISSVQIPDNILHWIFCLLNFLFAAFFEEVIYRFYFTDALISLLTKKNKKKIILIACEISGCFVFAFAHYYLGWLSVINAIFGHIILRVCYKKNKTLWPCVAAHFIYNVISLILL